MTPPLRNWSDCRAMVVMPRLQPRLQVGMVGALRGFMRMIHL